MLCTDRLKVVDPLTNGGLYLLTNEKRLTYMVWQTLPQECKHVLVGRELVIAFGARPTFGGEPPKPPGPNMQEDVGKLRRV